MKVEDATRQFESFRGGFHIIKRLYVGICGGLGEKKEVKGLGIGGGLRERIRLDRSEQVSAAEQEELRTKPVLFFDAVRNFLAKHGSGLDGGIKNGVATLDVSAHVVEL